MTISYERITEAPEEEIVDLYKAGGWWTESPEARAAIPRMLKGSYYVMGARDASGKLVGMGRVISDGYSDAYIQDVVVLAELRGKGIGAEIIRKMAYHCIDSGISWVGLIAEPGVDAFYERLGFAPMKDYQPMLFQVKSGE
jgi:GNAT superfamily N-acetyltransferase